MDDGRLEHVLELIDLANSQDPNLVNDGGEIRPAELVYGQRMSVTLEQFCNSASTELAVAARAQHLERWTVPRNSYPEGRIGYLKWRGELKLFHARRAGELMERAGYARSAIDRVGTLIRKKGMKSDVEAQMLEDVACLVFLEHYAGEFIAKHNDDKVIDILRKTIRKMSPDGVSAAGQLALPERLATLLTRALAESGIPRSDT